MSVSSLPFLIKRAAVLGAGTMGSRIAAHLTNAGIPVVLLDLAGKALPDGSSGKPFAALALESLAKSKPAAFFESSSAALITTGTFDDDLAKLSNCDWVVEAVTEDLAIKSALLTRVIPHLKPNALLTTNTSGIPVAKIAAAYLTHSAPSNPASSGLTFLIPRATCASLRSSPPPNRPRPPRGLLRIRRPRTWQRSCRSPRHSELHRQPHRHGHHFCLREAHV